MSLPVLDMTYLNNRGIPYQVAVESGMTCVVIPQWPLPKGLNHSDSDLLLRLSAGYPDVQPDMWWFDPPVRLADGRELPATNAVEDYLGRKWQRWSRHFSGSQWQSGMDSLESYLALIWRELERGVPEGAR